MPEPITVAARVLEALPNALFRLELQTEKRPRVTAHLAPESSILGLRPGEGEGNVYLLAPYDQGVFYAPMAKGGLPVVCLPQLYADLYHYERRGREQAAHLRREAMGY